MKAYCVALTGILLLTASVAQASRESFSIGVKGGTLGAGLEVGVKLDDDIRFRVGTNYISYNFDSDKHDVDYDYSTEFKNISLLFDWHPFSGSFFVSGGAYLTDHKIEFSGMLDSNGISSNASSYSYVTKDTKIEGEADLGSFSPYLGLGWRSNHRRDGISLACEFGILFTESPNVEQISMTNTKDGSRVTDSNKYLDTQISLIEDDLKGLRYYPVASFWVNYSF